MKKIYLFLLTLCLVSVYSLPAAGYNWPAQGDDLAFVEKDGIHYTVKGKDQVYIMNSRHYDMGHCDLLDETNYSWLDGRDVEIPRSVYVSDGWHAIFSHQNIIGVERYAFKNMTAKVNIWLPSTIKTIDPYSFYNATGLQNIYLQEGVFAIGHYAFYGCSNLFTVNLPSTLTEIENNTFENCTSLPNIIIPSSIKTIGHDAFSRCTSIQIVAGKSSDYIWVSEIGDRAFYGCTNLEFIRFSIMLESIGENAFYNCKKLKELVLPANLKTIDSFAFGYTGLQTVTNYSQTPQSIEANVFDGVDLSKCLLYVPKGCKGKYQNAEVWKKFGQILEVGDRPSVTGIRKIGNLYYDLHEDMTATLVKHDGNSNLSGSLVIPSTVSFEEYGFTYTYTVNKMEEAAFTYCTNLTSVELPVTLDEIPASAFSGCAGLTKVTFPSSLSKIGAAAFNNCSALKNLALPGSLKEIGASAFSGCKSLTYVSVPAGVEVLPYSCFMECSQLSTILLPEGLKEIGAHAFNLCTALTTITLPESLTKLGDYALTAGANLTSIRSLNEAPPTATDATFGSVASSGKCIVYVPVGSKEAYQKATGWKNFTDIRERGENKKVKYGKFYYQLKEDLTAYVTYETKDANNYKDLSGEITVEDKVIYQGLAYTVNEVGIYAFENCKGITKVNLPKIMDEISKESFKNCSNLAEINIPATLRLLYKDAFEGTKLFNENKDKDGAVYYDGCLLFFPVSTIEGEYAVKEGTRLLATNVFENDEKITSLVLPEGVQCLCNYAISYMYALKKLSLPSSIFHIGDGFCNDCFYLSEIYNNSNVPYNMTDVYCFDNVNPSKCSLYVPNGSKEAYQNADKWKDLNIVEMEPTNPDNPDNPDGGDGALAGTFTINAQGDKVVFSQGNLQYQASTGIWRFAEHQYDYVGDDYYGNVYIDSEKCDNAKVSDTYSGWIDLFGWGTGRYPTKLSPDLASYSEFVDWGRNRISNGGNEQFLWRTLTKDEIYYIMEKRPNAKDLEAVGTVNHVPGYIILPDSWQMPQGIEFDGSARDNYTINSYNSAQWSVMEAAGAVFFPSAGVRVSRWYGTNRIAVDIYNPEKIGAYWTSTPSTTDGWAYLLYIDSWSWPKTYEQGRSSGYSVRLVQDHAQKTEVYTEFVESTGTLTYYYDNKRDERKGVTEVYNPIKTPDALRFNDYNHKIVKAVIDPSMKNAPLTSTNGMFYGGTNTETFSVKTLYNMTTIEGLGNLNTAIMTDMQSMFFSCSALTMLDLSSFNTSKVTSMNGMFLGCNKLEVVDVSSFDISNVTDLYMMFSGCSKLKTIYCSNDWSTSSARSDYMFSVCNSLVGGKGTVFDSKVIDNTYARPDGGESAPGYFTDDTITRINSLTPALSKGEGAIYNLSGQRVNRPVQKGLYIINGKKVVK